MIKMSSCLVVVALFKPPISSSLKAQIEPKSFSHVELTREEEEKQKKKGKKLGLGVIYSD